MGRSRVAKGGEEERTGFYGRAGWRSVRPGRDWLYTEPESFVLRLEYGLRYGNAYPSCLASLA